MIMNIFLDDTRPAPKNFILIKSGEKLIHFLSKNTENIELISLDHDLGEGLSGYDTIKILINEYPFVFNKIHCIKIHSSNFVGAENMKLYIKNAIRCHIITSSVKLSD